jgi:ABC-type transport system involved in cytochrome c biogenesis permease subunit
VTALRGLAVALGAAALWFAWQTTSLLFVAWYSEVEWSSPAAPWLAGVEVVVLTMGGIAALVFAATSRRQAARP